jgi:hypothetical protein
MCDGPDLSQAEAFLLQYHIHTPKNPCRLQNYTPKITEFVAGVGQLHAILLVEH